MHEEQGVGQVFPRAPGISEALPAPGLLPAEAGAEDPQVPPTAARKSPQTITASLQVRARRANAQAANASVRT